MFAHELTKQGKRCLVLDRRQHIGGNVYTETIDRINVHRYGAHIFHTSDKALWEYVNQFAETSTRNLLNTTLKSNGEGLVVSCHLLLFWNSSVTTA